MQQCNKASSVIEGECNAKEFNGANNFIGIKKKQT